MDHMNQKSKEHTSEDEYVEKGKNILLNGIKRAVLGLLLFAVVLIAIKIGTNIFSSYPDVVSVNEVYKMEYPGDYVQEHVGEKIHFSDVVIWNTEPSSGLAQDALFDIYFKNPDDVAEIAPMDSIVIKGELSGFNASGRVLIKNAILEKIDGTNESLASEQSQPEPTYPSENSYDICISAEQLIEEADANIARVIGTYAGKRVMITDLKIIATDADSAYFDAVNSIYFRDPNDLYSIKVDDKITVIGSIEEFVGTYAIMDAVLVNNPDISIQNQSSEPDAPSSTDDNPDLVPDADTVPAINLNYNSYDSNWDFVNEHIGEWVRMYGVAADMRCTDYTYGPESYIYMDPNDPNSHYGDFIVYGENRSMCIPIADNLTDDFLIYITTDGDKVIGINATPANDNLSSDPGYGASEPY